MFAASKGAGSHETVGIDLAVCRDRVILLDAQVIFKLFCIYFMIPVHSRRSFAHP